MQTTHHNITPEQAGMVLALAEHLGATCTVYAGPTDPTERGGHPDNWLMDVQCDGKCYRLMQGRALPLDGTECRLTFSGDGAIGFQAG